MMKTLALLSTVAVMALGAPTMASAADAAPASAAPAAADIIRAGDDLPPPITRSAPQTVKVELETREVLGKLADGATYKYWTFNGKVPGPMVRVRVGDTVEVTLKNAADSAMMHNIDLHAVTGPGGGGGATMAMPGETKGFTFKALKAGLYVYHCASPMVSQHIANGMYGMILVEPEGGLPKVDREFYVMQGEIYTDEPLGAKGELNESIEKLLNEQPEYYVMNGAFKALTGEHRMHARTGETVRIYFGDGGPNKSSNFHVIGGIFDKAYPLGAFDGAVKDIQTLAVPPGGATVVELKFQNPGLYSLVDHALSRAERGDAAVIDVEGPPAPDVFKAPPGSSSTMTH
jgi:nitrite reductase (NO-forming)